MKKVLRRVLLLLLSASTAAILAYAAAIYGLALCPKEKLIGNRCLPDDRRGGLHNDYPKILGWIPRAATAGCFVEPPTLLMGRDNPVSKSLRGEPGPAPIPKRRGWQFSLVQEKRGWPLYIPYFAITTHSGWHARIGCRWDDTAHNFIFPTFTIKKLARK